MRVIMPSVEIYDKRESTYVIPCLSILKRLSDQLPDEIAFSSPWVIYVTLKKFSASKGMPSILFFLLANFVSSRSIIFLKLNWKSLN